ncbi:MAG: hypothetical protein LBI99_07825, partial [Propionibacteriaceae bacterium]|nr:hypothetical protein [Propionibacteriaceae bacterium]
MWNPFGALADAIINVAEQFLAKICLMFWEGCIAIWAFFQGVLDLVTKVDLDAGNDHPLGKVLPTTMWIALALATVLLVGQLMITLARRDGKQLGRAVMGSVQFVLVCAAVFGIAVLIDRACTALARDLSVNLLKIDDFFNFNFDGSLSGLATQTVGTANAVVLAVCGPFVVLASFAHFFIQLALSASKIVILATLPISAAGLVMDSTKVWFFKSLRWFVAACVAKPLMTLVFAVAVKYSEAVSVSQPDAPLGSALASVALICVAVVSPMALFKLLAFVDPTSS